MKSIELKTIRDQLQAAPPVGFHGPREGIAKSGKSQVGKRQPRA